MRRTRGRLWARCGAPTAPPRPWLAPTNVWPPVSLSLLPHPASSCSAASGSWAGPVVPRWRANSKGAAANSAAMSSAVSVSLGALARALRLRFFTNLDRVRFLPRCDVVTRGGDAVCDAAPPPSCAHRSLSATKSAGGQSWRNSQPGGRRMASSFFLHARDATPRHLRCGWVVSNQKCLLNHLKHLAQIWRCSIGTCGQLRSRAGTPRFCADREHM